MHFLDHLLSRYRIQTSLSDPVIFLLRGCAYWGIVLADEDDTGREGGSVE
jgi:hypothetical protein